MTLTIKLPESYDFGTADECAMHMASATEALNRRLKPQVEHGLMKKEAADHKLHLYRSIASVLDAVLAAMEGTELNRTTREMLAEAAANVVPPGAPKPSETDPSDYLRCAGCGFLNEADQFLDGNHCPVLSLRSDFFSCPECGSFDIKKTEEANHA